MRCHMAMLWIVRRCSNLDTDQGGRSAMEFSHLDDEKMLGAASVHVYAGAQYNAVWQRSPRIGQKTARS